MRKTLIIAALALSSVIVCRSREANDAAGLTILNVNDLNDQHKQDKEALRSEYDGKEAVVLSRATDNFDPNHVYSACAMLTRIESSFFSVKGFQQGAPFSSCRSVSPILMFAASVFVGRGREAAELVEGGGFNFFGDEREGREDVGELVLGEVVEVRDHAVEFGAKLCALLHIGRAFGVVFQAGLTREVIKLRGGADELGGAFDDGRKLPVFFCQARNRKRVNVEKVKSRRNFHSEHRINDKAIPNSTEEELLVLSQNTVAGAVENCGGGKFVAMKSGRDDRRD